MKDIIERVKAYRILARQDAMGHLVAAEYHRSKDMQFGVASIALSTLVSAGVFVGLSKQFTLDNSHSEISWILTIVISAVLVGSPILTAVYKFMHNAEDAASHNTSAARYDLLVRHYDLFLMEFADADASKRDQAIKALRDLDAQYAAARENNITLDDKAKIKAKELLREEKRSHNLDFQNSVDHASGA